VINHQTSFIHPFHCTCFAVSLLIIRRGFHCGKGMDEVVLISPGSQHIGLSLSSRLGCAILLLGNHLCLNVIILTIGVVRHAMTAGAPHRALHVGVIKLNKLVIHGLLLFTAVPPVLCTSVTSQLNGVSQGNTIVF
jgi:hypothetical protein